eukprot:5218914-Alexandrium_andersonii.AAC.1
MRDGVSELPRRPDLASARAIGRPGDAGLAQRHRGQLRDQRVRGLRRVARGDEPDAGPRGPPSARGLVRASVPRPWTGHDEVVQER